MGCPLPNVDLSSEACTSNICVLNSILQQLPRGQKVQGVTRRPVFFSNCLAMSALRPWIGALRVMTPRTVRRDGIEMVGYFIEKQGLMFKGGVLHVERIVG